MAYAQIFKGTSMDQDHRFGDKKKKLMRNMKFSENVDKKVDMSKVKLDILKPWITSRITQILNIEDDVVTEFVFNQLEAKHPDGKEIQINLTGFLNAKNARIFIEELWSYLLSAMGNASGIPAVFLEQKKEEIRKKQLEEEERKQKRCTLRERSRSKSSKRKRSDSFGRSLNKTTRNIEKGDSMGSACKKPDEFLKQMREEIEKQQLEKEKRKQKSCNLRERSPSKSSRHKRSDSHERSRSKYSRHKRSDSHERSRSKFSRRKRSDSHERSRSKYSRRKRSD